MEFDSIKKSVIFQSTRAWPKASLVNARDSDNFAPSTVTVKNSSNTARDHQIEQDHSQRMLQFLQKIQKQKTASCVDSDQLMAVHADRIKRTLSRQILRNMSQRPMEPPIKQ